MHLTNNSSIFTELFFFAERHYLNLAGPAPSVEYEPEWRLIGSAPGRIVDYINQLISWINSDKLHIDAYNIDPMPCQIQDTYWSRHCADLKCCNIILLPILLISWIITTNSVFILTLSKHVTLMELPMETQHRSDAMPNTRQTGQRIV